MHDKANLTRKELAETLNNQLGLSQTSCSQIVDTFFSRMKQSMIDDESVKIVHFGTFSVRSKAPRRGRNPHTGETITIQKRRTISFRPSKKLRQLVNS
ncbi:MAG: integration host factor subunit alpha [Deltaproteobacteria bacterium]|nr:MAG: integration host factor subunit alpha [Deltaproteobacteria bacterium]